MKLKKWNQFITESLSDRNFWNLSEKDILEYFFEFLDNGYEVDIELGFYDERNDCYSDNVFSGDNYPAYRISIICNGDLLDEDLTDTLKFAMDILEDEANAKCRLEDQSGLVDKEEIIIKSGFFLKEEPDNSDLIDNAIYILAIENKAKHISEKEVAEYYEWENIISDSKGYIYTEIDIEEMVNILLDRNSDYRNIIIKGEESLWQYYDAGDYILDNNDIFQYLSKENIELLIKVAIKELGGLEKLIKNCDNPDLKGKNEKEIIDYLQKERFNETILKIIKKLDVIIGIKHIIADYSASAHLYKNYNEIIKEFDDLVDKVFPDNTKIIKKEEKAWTSTDKDGNKTIHKYTEDVTYYKLAYQNEWLKYIDDPSDFASLEGVFKEYAWNKNLHYKLDPRLSDYGDINEQDMNKDITFLLKELLNN